MDDIESTSAGHKISAPGTVSIAIITVSDTRDIADDKSGRMIAEAAKAHNIVKHIMVKDNPALIKNEIDDIFQDSFNQVDAIIVNGGTGLSKKDVTIETVRPLFEKEITGFGMLMANVSYAEIGPAAMLSRATAGIVRGKVIFCLPGSPHACRLAMERLVLPEIGHIIKHLED